MKKHHKYKQMLSKTLSCFIALLYLLQTSVVRVNTEETEKYPYSLFGRNEITINADNLCINGNLHTNKEASIYALNNNINGYITTKDDIEKRIKHIYADKKIFENYFTENCEFYEEEYIYSDLNIHINNPLFCYNNIFLDGNIALNSNLGTLMNLNITGEVKNANNSVIYSKYGDITIENDSTTNINGLIYAPLGTLNINSPNVTINAIIIADKIIINGSSVNVNNNDNISRFIGNTSEIYDFSGLEYLPNEWLGDSDEDELFDIYEKVIDTELLNPDTDGDKLPDGYEVLTLNTNPLEIDTNENGISDSDEDFDSDNLNNIGEYQNDTKPFNPDTDEDMLSDGDEINIYGTIPTNPDTDNDYLLDGEEGYNGSIYEKYGVYFDPLNPDTDKNTIIDGEEIFGQSKQQEVETQDEALIEISVDMNTNGNIDRNVSIESMYNVDTMSSNVYALIGEPFNFTSTSNFDSATITFKINQSKLGDTKFDDLIILWYNEEEQIFEEMPTTRDEYNSTVSTITTHFSQYMVVDSAKWYQNWDNSLNQLRNMWIGSSSYQRNLNTVIMLDCSSNMEITDNYRRVLKPGYNGVTNENISTIKINSTFDVERYCIKLCNRFDICNGIINNMGYNDTLSIITFSDSVNFNTGLTNDKEILRNSLQQISNEGISRLDDALSTALSYVCEDTTDIYRLIVVTDNNIGWDSLSSDFFANNVIFNVVNLGSEPIGYGIEEIAQSTNGDVYNAVSANDLTYQCGGIITSPEQYIGTDSDEDGIPDLVELYGLKPNGDPIATNPNEKDTDDDGIDDNVELCYIGDLLTSDVNLTDYVQAVRANSDPTKPDTDDDGLSDNLEIISGTNPLSSDTDKDKLSDGLEVELWFNPRDPNPDGDSYSDLAEYSNETNPFHYDLTPEECADEFIRGILQGDFIEDPSVPALCGQVLGSVIPVVGGIGDLRDTVANAYYNDWIMSIMSALGAAPAIGDTAKAASKVGEFIAKNIDKTDEIAELLIRLYKNFPDDFHKLIPKSSLDEIEKMLDNTDKLSKSEYSNLKNILEKCGKNVDDYTSNDIVNIVKETAELTPYADEITDIVKYSNKDDEFIEICLKHKDNIKDIIEIITKYTEYCDQLIDILKDISDITDFIKFINNYGENGIQLLLKYNKDIIKTFNNSTSIIQTYRNQIERQLKEHNLEVYNDQDNIFTICMAVDLSDPNHIVGFGLNGIYRENYVLETDCMLSNYTFKESNNYIMRYRELLSDEFIDEYFEKNPDVAEKLDKNSVKHEMEKLRERIDITKDSGIYEYYNEGTYCKERSVDNCAEIWAVWDAILQGGKLENIALKAWNVKNNFYMKPCDNCCHTFSGFISLKNGEIING